MRVRVACGCVECVESWCAERARRESRTIDYRDSSYIWCFLFSLAWITAIPFSMVHLPLWSIPCSAYKTNSLNFLTLPSIALTAWRNCTGYRSIIASSSKSPSWHIELSRHPIHPISNTSFSAVIHLVFAHLPPFNYTNQFTNHPSSHQQRLLVCLSCCLECITSPSKRSTIPGALQTHLFRTPTWS